MDSRFALVLHALSDPSPLALAKALNASVTAAMRIPDRTKSCGLHRRLGRSVAWKPGRPGRPSGRKRSKDWLDQSTRAEEKLAQLNRELLHRIRNIFTLATSIASQTSRHAASPADMASALISRFQALAVAQELLVANELAGVDLKQLASDTLKPLSPNVDRLKLSGPPLHLSPDSTTSLCLVLHELATNPVKYGAWSNSRGTVNLEWSVARHDGMDPLVTVRWLEKVGPPCRVPDKSGLGTVLIGNALADAVVQREFLANGLHCSMRFPQTSA